MTDYIKQDKQKKVKSYLIKIVFLLLVFIICILAYYIYLKIDIEEQGKTSTVKIEKMSQTVEDVEQKDTTIIQVIQEINETVVGISKIKEAGDSIFLEDGVSQLGLGTGLIVAENGYILTNEHVSGKKNSTCYITLSTGKTYTGTVVWSNSDVDMAIIKIKEKNLQFATLGDSDEVEVGESVYAIGNPIGFEFQRTVTSRNN